eukprot:scaffold52911_cov21-Prasinocladus_malaysianus.AAC.2
MHLGASTNLTRYSSPSNFQLYRHSQAPGAMWPRNLQLVIWMILPVQLIRLWGEIRHHAHLLSHICT